MKANRFSPDIGTASGDYRSAAQTDQTAGSGEEVRTYSLMREDEDWSFLKDPSVRQDFWDPVKYIRLGPDGWFLTIGGEAREAFEQVGNGNWGKQNYTNAFFLERYMLHTDRHLVCPRICAVKEWVGIIPHRRPETD